MLIQLSFPFGSMQEPLVNILPTFTSFQPSSRVSNIGPSAFAPEEAKRIWDRFEFVYTPKHGSWLNMAEIELHVLMGQCLNRRIDNIKTMKEEVAAWQKHRNNKLSKIDW